MRARRLEAAPARVAALLMVSAALAACGDHRSSDARASAPAEVVPGGTTPGTSRSAAPGGGSPPGAAAATTPSPSASAAVVTSATSAASAASAPSAASASTTGGAGDCKLRRGPARLSMIGAVAVSPTDGGVFGFALNKEGAPAWESPRFPEPPRVSGRSTLLPPPRPSASGLLPGPGASEAAEAPPERTRLPACGFAGGMSFCADGEGAIFRRPAAGGEAKVVARGRKGTPVAAAASHGHTFYAFLGNQKTTEGLVVRAFVAFDDEVPIPLSEEGSGATHIGLVARDADVLAMYIDARTALTPVHARTLRAEGRLVRGADAVVYVGGGADSIVRGAIGRGASGPALLFVPGSHDDRDFGVVSIPVDGEPKDDMPVKWSRYPAAMTSPALAATSGATPVRLLRSRPEAKEPGAPHVLELGHVDAGGGFTERCVIAKGGPFSDLAAAVDGAGRLWIAYSTPSGTWVEERVGGAKEK